jgi:hypothetical protein
VDATYIPTLVNSDRQNNINEQLKTCIPTKKIFIVNNKGYKNVIKYYINKYHHMI